MANGKENGSKKSSGSNHIPPPEVIAAQRQQLSLALNRSVARRGADGRGGV